MTAGCAPRKAATGNSELLYFHRVIVIMTQIFANIDVLEAIQAIICSHILQLPC